MSWYRQNRDASRGRRAMLAATLFVLLITLFDMWSGGIPRAYARFASIFIGGSVYSVSEWVANVHFFSSRRALIAENETLRAALDTLKDETAIGAILREENTALRSMLRVREREQGVTVPVASSFRASPYGTFLIGAGEEAGVFNGDTVLSGSGFVIGEVTDSTPGSALVTTVFASRSTVGALMSGVSVEVEGRGNGNARAEVPRDAKVFPGDIVIAPEYGGRPIGIVGEVVSESGSASQEVFIRLPVNLETLRFVYIAKGL